MKIIIVATILLLQTLFISGDANIINDFLNDTEAEKPASTLCIGMTPICDQELERNTTECSCFYREDYLCCDLNHEAGVVSSNKWGNFSSVRVSRSRSVTYWCTDTLLQTVTFVAVGNINIRKTMENCILNVIALNSMIRYLSFNTNIKAINTSIAIIEKSYSMNELILHDSDVGSLRGIYIAHEYFKYSQCLEIKKSKFQEITDVFADCSGVMSDNTIHTINNLTLKDSLLTNLIVVDVRPNGLILEEGKHYFMNVVFGNVYEKGIVIDTDIPIRMENTLILLCFSPCIVVRRGRIEQKTMSINHKKRDISKPNEFIVYEQAPIEKIKEWDCHSTENLKVCDLSFFHNKDVWFASGNSTKLTLLVNHQSVAVRCSCVFNLQLKNITGNICHHNDGTTVCEKLMSCPIHENSLLLKNSSLHYIKLESSTRLEMDFCNVKDIDISIVNDLIINNTNIGSIEYLDCSPDAPKTYCLIQNTNIQSIDNLNMNRKALLENVTVYGKIKSISLTPEREETVFSNVYIQEVGRKGILVKGGNLVFANVTIGNLDQYGISLGPHSTLLMKRGTKVFCNGGWSVNVLQQSQILTQRSYAAWFRKCRNLREDESSGNTYVITSKDCKISLSRAFCDMTAIREQMLISSKSGLNTSEVTISNGRKLQMGDHCFKKVFLNNVYLDKISENSCKHILNTTDSIIEIITDRVSRMFAHETIVHLLNAKLDFAEVSHSDIDNLTGEVIYVFFSDTNIFYITDLKVVTYFKISRSEISKISENGLIIEKTSKVIIDNGVIDKIDTAGITVKGHLILQNIDIKYAYPRCFNVHNSSKVTFLNVSIENMAPYLFGNDSTIDFELHLLNVSMSGEKFTKEDAFVNRSSLYETHGEDGPSTNPEGDSILFVTGMAVLGTLLVLIIIIIALYYYLMKTKLRIVNENPEVHDNTEQVTGESPIRETPTTKCSCNPSRSRRSSARSTINPAAKSLAETFSNECESDVGQSQKNAAPAAAAATEMNPMPKLPKNETNESIEMKEIKPREDN